MSPRSVFRKTSVVAIVLCLSMGGLSVLAVPPSASSASSWADTELDLANYLSPPSTPGMLTSVVCTAGTTCVGAGGDQNNDLTSIVGDATTWGQGQVTETYPNTVNGGEIYALSCTSQTTCVGVGNDQNDQPIVVEGDPSSWTSADVQEISLGGAFGNGGSFTSISCVSSPSLWCMAVGSGNNSSALVMDGSPTAWNTPYVVSPPLGASAELFGVSCTSSTFCVAVGNDSDASGSPFVIYGDPTSGWTTANSFDSPFATTAGFSSVSCTSATFCVAVGSDANSLPIVVAGDPAGASWKNTGPSEVNLSTWGPDGFFDGVTCQDQTDCVAVGSVDDQMVIPGEDLPLIFSGDPSTWAANQSDGQAIVIPAVYGSGTLNAVSCTAVGTCVGVGSAQDDNGNPCLLSVVESTPLASSPTRPSFPVTYVAGGGTGTVPAPMSEEPGVTFGVAAPGNLSQSGFTFAGWSDGTSTYQPGASYTMPSAPVTFTALWTPFATTTTTSPVTTTVPPPAATKLRDSIYFPFNRH
ncbi:MAG: InlB B-repeat-containing protein [Acidimicrobiales bacterium]